MIKPLRRELRMRRVARSPKTLSRGALRRCALSRETGALTLSYVIIVPVFLIGIMTIVQASIWFLAKDSVLAAARHGADVARTSQPPPGNGAQAAISFATSSTSTFLNDVSASATVTNAKRTVRVTVTARIPSLVPDLTIKVREVVTAPIEKFVALGDPAVLARTGLTALAPAPSSHAFLGRKICAGSLPPFQRPVRPVVSSGVAESQPWLVRS
jgi:Flp pilus assembly protein TadG